MKIRLEDLNNDKDHAAKKMIDGIGKQYRSFNDYVAFRDNDNMGMLIFKLSMRFVGFIFMLILSPFLIVGLLIAFADVA